MRRSFVSGQNDVVYFASGRTLTATEREGLTARSVAVVDGAVERVVIDDDQLLGVELKDGGSSSSMRCSCRRALFRTMTCSSSSAATSTTTAGLIIDATGRTSVAGVWAAGNVTNPRAQVITAAGEGSAAAIALNADLVADDVARAVQRG